MALGVSTRTTVDVRTEAVDSGENEASENSAESDYFPMQKRPNISPSKSSAENSPVIEASAS